LCLDLWRRNRRWCLGELWHRAFALERFGQDLTTTGQSLRRSSVDRFRHVCHKNAEFYDLLGYIHRVITAKGAKAHVPTIPLIWEFLGKSDRVACPSLPTVCREFKRLRSEIGKLARGELQRQWREGGTLPEVLTRLRSKQLRFGPLHERRLSHCYPLSCDSAVADACNELIGEPSPFNAADAQREDWPVWQFVGFQASMHQKEVHLLYASESVLRRIMSERSTPDLIAKTYADIDRLDDYISQASRVVIVHSGRACAVWFEPTIGV
jgi:hypothetical protein